MPDNNVRIKLSADTTQAQKDIKLIDKQLKELGKEAGSKRSEKESNERASARDAGLGNLDSLINVNKQILKVLNNMYRMDNNPNSNKSIKYLAGRIDALGESVKGTSSGNSKNNPEGTTTGIGAHHADTSSKTPSNSGKSSEGGSGGGSPGDALKLAAGKLASVTAALAVLKGIGSWVGAGAQKSASLESKAYTTYNSTGIFGSNFSSARNYAYGIGNPYGYGSEATMDFQDSYMARAGFTNQENLTSDTTELMRVSKAYGIDLTSTGSAAGKLSQTGTFASGEQSKFANLLATSINEAGMTGRESEQLDVLESINDTLARTLVTVSEDGQNNATALYSLLAATEDSLKGARGGSAIASINDAITGGGNSMDVLLGWGTAYTGAAGRWELERRKAEGISNPDNLSKIFSNYERFTGQSINSAQGKLALQQLLGIDPELVEVLVRNSESIRTGTYSDSFISSLKSYSGDADVSGLLDNYTKSKVSTQEQFTNAKENAQSSAGDVWNSVTSPFKDWFTGLSPGEQVGTTVGGMAAGGYAGTKGAKWAINRGSSVLGKIFKGSGTGAVDDAANVVDDAAKAAGNSLGDIAKAATGSADEVAKAATIFGKAGKILGWVGIGIEAISTAVDTKEALDRGDGRSAASEIGEGLGSIAAGAAASIGIGAALSATGVGAPIGIPVMLAGTIVASLLGGKAGSAAGKGLYDVTHDTSKDGGFRLGLDYVPYDDFRAILHQGEAVLTADEAKMWRKRNSIEGINKSISVPQSSGSAYTGTNLLEIKLSGAVDGMTYENQHIIVQAVIQQLGLSRSPILGNLGNSFVRTPN